jgi:hypothetical protein
VLHIFAASQKRRARAFALPGVVFCRWADALPARRLVFAAERRPPASEHSRTRLKFRSNNRRALDDFCNLAHLLKKPAENVAHDLVTYATVPAVLTAARFLTCALSAWRAGRVEPATALRADS